MNTAIGEKGIRLGGVDYVLRPSFRAYSEIESLTGKDTLSLAAEFTSGKPRMRDVAVVVWACYRAADLEPGKDVLTLDQVGEMVYRADYLEVAKVAVSLLVNALQQGESAKKKETETKT
jgi:hypothetical protein